MPLQHRLPQHRLPLGRVYFWLSCVLLGLAPGWWLTPKPRAQAQTQVPVLVLGQSQERTLTPSERHLYQINLAAGQFLKLELWQRETLIDVTIYSPQGERLYQRHRTGIPTPKGGLHTPKLVVESAGLYRLELKLHPAQAKAGQYDLTLVELRSANEDDRALQGVMRQMDEVGLLQSRYDVGTLEERRAIRSQQEFDRAIGLGEQSLAVYQRLLPPNTSDIGNLAIVLANMYAYRGYYGDSERLEEVWEIAALNRERLLGPHDYQAIALYQVTGKATHPARAERWFRKALAAAEAKLGPTDPFVAVMLCDLADNLRLLGEHQRAAEPLQRVAAIVAQWLPDPNCLVDPLCRQEISTAQLSLGTVALEQGRLAEAERYLQQAGSFWADSAAPDSYGRRPVALLQLGLLYQRKGDYAQAESFLRQLIRFEEQGHHPLQIGQAYQALGNLCLAKKAYKQAAESFRQAQESLEKTGKSPALARLWRDWRSLHLATGHVTAALAAQQAAVEITEADLNRLLVSGSEWEKLKLLALAQQETNETLTLLTKYAPHSKSALQLAFTTWLQRKGRVQDAMNQTVEFLRSRLRPELTPLFNDLLNKQSQLARLLTGLRNEKDHAAQVEQLTLELEQVQRTLSAQSQEFRARTQPVTLAAVQAALPKETALVDFARFEPFDEQTQRPLPARYLAYLLLPKGPPRWFDLGEAQKVEQLVKRWRKALAPNRSTPVLPVNVDVRQLARQLDALVMQPLRPWLGRTRQVLLAPDGALNLIPFAALLDEHKRELVWDYQFIYLTSGRDLLRLGIKHERNTDVLVFAAPDYDDAGEGAPPSALAQAERLSSRPGDERRRSVSKSRSAAALGRFEPLAAAAAEASAIKSQWPQAQLFLGKQALESALKHVQRPALLHIATHGVFLEDQEWEIQREKTLTSTTPRIWENPLLRSWLALAGANQRKSGDEDGILTAYEAAALDLWGTKLVVLSACETGLGEVKNGEGVYGLRRALVLAGAESQLTTLWQVDDQVTKDLMSDYYGMLKAGRGRAAALREVQLRMLQDRARRNPYFWAGFIQLGEWANLAGQRPPALSVSSAPSVRPAQRTTRKE